MAYVHSGPSRLHQIGLIARIHQIREMLKRSAARRAVYRQTVDELQANSDRELADLGFHRSEIPRIAREAADQL